MTSFQRFSCILGLFVSFSSMVQAKVYATRTESTSTAILVENLPENSPGFQRLCAIAREEVGKWSTIVPTPIACLVSATQLEALQRDHDKMYGTVVRLTVRDSKLTLGFHVLTLEDAVYPIDVIKGDFAMSDRNFERVLRAAISSYGAFDRNNVAIREYFIQNYVAAELIDAKKSRGEKTTPDLSVQQREFDQAYVNFNRQNPENKRYVAANLMSAVVLGVGTLNYYRDHNPNVHFADDDYDTFGESMKHRLDFSAVRFDDNKQLVNIGHMYAGTLHYTIARDSGLSRWDSLLHAFVLSSLWEYFSECKQVVSINDQISTTLGGFVIGENVHQITRILQKGNGGPLQRALAKVFGGPQHLSQWVENTARGGDTRYDDQYLSTAEQDFWSKMSFYLSGEKRDGSGVISAGVEAEIVNIPQFDQPGNVASLLLDDTVQSKFRLEMGRGANLKTFKLFAKTTLAAYYRKNMQLTKDEKLKGYQFFVGPAMMVDIDAKFANEGAHPITQGAAGTDIEGVIGVVGNTLDMRAVTGGLQLHAVIDVYGDFATVRSLAFSPATNDRYDRDQFVPGNCDGIQSVMCNYSYYYGIGWTQLANFDLRDGRVSAGGEYKSTSLSSIEGRSRFGESQRLAAHDRVSKSSAWVAYDLNRDVKVEIGAERRIHVSYFGGATVVARESIVKGRLIYKLQ